jgi:hypothetical protein
MSHTIDSLQIISVEDYEAKHGKGCVDGKKISKARRKAEQEEVTVLSFLCMSLIHILMYVSYSHSSTRNVFFFVLRTREVL